jgi:hypothetical protein
MAKVATSRTAPHAALASAAVRPGTLRRLLRLACSASGRRWSPAYFESPPQKKNNINKCCRD